MNYIMLILSIILLNFVFSARKTIREINIMSDVPKRIYYLLNFVKFAPIIALLTLMVIVMTTLHTKTGVRLSHAWYVAQLWAYGTFFYCSYMISKKKIILVPMAVSFILAVYITPLFHYESLFAGYEVVVADIIATCMFVALWWASSKAIMKIKGPKTNL